MSKPTRLTTYLRDVSRALDRAARRAPPPPPPTPRTPSAHGRAIAQARYWQDVRGTIERAAAERPGPVAALKARLRRRDTPAAALAQAVRRESNAVVWRRIASALASVDVAFDVTAPIRNHWSPYEPRPWASLVWYGDATDAPDVIDEFVGPPANVAAPARHPELWDAGSPTRANVHLTMRPGVALTSLAGDWEGGQAWGFLVALAPAGQGPTEAQWERHRARRWDSDAAQAVRDMKAQKDKRRAEKRRAARRRKTTGEA